MLRSVVHRPAMQPLESRTLLALTAVGSETITNTFTTGDQYAPVVAADDSGNFVVVWVSDGQDGSGPGAYYRRFNSAGTALDASGIRANNYTSGAQAQPAVAMDPGGNFVIAWTTDAAPGGSALDVMARRFSAAGTALDANEFLVNTTLTNNQDSPSVARDAAGNFVIVWESNGNSQDTSSYGVICRRFNAAGAQLQSEFRINGTTTNFQGEPAVAMDRSGKFVVAWSSGSTVDEPFYDVYARRFDAAGSALAGEFLVNTANVTDYQISPTIAADADGDFVIAWQSFVDGADLDSLADNWDLYAQRYTSAGATNGSAFLVNSTATVGNQTAPDVAMSKRGDFTFVWQTPDGTGLDVYFRSFSFNGTQVNAPTRVNAVSSNDRHRAAIAHDANGNAIVVWQANLQDGSGYGVYRQWYTAPDQLAPTVTSATFNYLTSQSVVLTFNEGVTGFTTGDITLENLTTSTTVNTSLAYSGGTNPATITFPSGQLADGNYRITLTAGGITDGAGHQLDGDNNGTAGGNYTFDFFILRGDANHDRSVTISDLGDVASNWQATGVTWAQGDFNYDGAVTISDLGDLASNWQVSLPVPPPQPLSMVPVRSASGGAAVTRKTQPTRVASSILA